MLRENNGDLWRMFLGDSRDVLRSFSARSFGSMVCDPPAGVNHLRKNWDKGGPAWVEWLAGIFDEAKRLLFPGSYAAVWAYPRTSYLTAMALEMAGFEIMQQIVNNLGRGCCNGNVDVAKAVESQILFGNSSCNTWRKLKGTRRSGTTFGRNITNVLHGDRPKAYDGTGAFDLDPQTEEAARWLGWGTFVMPVHEVWWLARVPLEEKTIAAQVIATGTGGLNLQMCRIGDKWPSSVVSFPPASDEERGRGCENLPVLTTKRVNGGGGLEEESKWGPVSRRNTHPTVKSVGICRHLVRLTTPKDKAVLDPFAGSGTTLLAAIVEGVRSVGVELEPRHFMEATARCRRWEADRERDDVSGMCDGPEEQEQSSEACREVRKVRKGVVFAKKVVGLGGRYGSRSGLQIVLQRPACSHDAGGCRVSGVSGEGEGFQEKETDGTLLVNDDTPEWP